VLRWTDTSRPEVLSSSLGDRREVVAWIWYPASPQAGAKAASYVDEFDRVAKGLSRAEASVGRKGVAHAIANARLSDVRTPWPIVFFSPGSGMVPALYTTFCEELASHGFVVVALDHPYDDRAVLLSDGRVVKQAKQPDGGEELLRFERERVAVRTQDLRYALDQLTRMESGDIADPLRGHLDLSHVGVIGHSVGGMTAARFCQDDPRVGACGNLDGVVAAMPAYVEPGSGIDRPFLFMQKPFAPMRGESRSAAEQRVGMLRAKSNPVFANVRSGRSYRVTVADATHESFSDLEVLTKDSVRHQQQLALVRDYVRAFFDRNLKGVNQSLLDEEPGDPAIRVEVFEPR
jgi:alpha-beta hydrolase superfamily lysophospholipase